MDRPLYETVILAGDKGPVFPEIPVRTSEKALKLTLECLYGMRSVYKGGLFPGVSPEGMNRIQNVVITYKKVSDEDLQEMVMEQISWQQARKSGRPYNLDDIRKDAQNIRPYDNAWDLYYDEPIRGWKPVIANKKHVIEIYFDEIFLLKAMNVLMYKKAFRAFFFVIAWASLRRSTALRTT